DAPSGTKGISLFVVPKFLLDDDGTPGARNTVEVVSIEHKLGIHASPTCVLSFEDATGYLIGEENQGMRYMFTMMNQARLEVGLEGLSVAERAYQHAAAYAKDRKQGRALGASDVSPIVEHPDVRRMLMTMKAYTEAMRALVYDAVAADDRMHSAATKEERDAARDRLALLTPITKSWCTDHGVELASIGVQVFGGMGFIEESGAAQFYRDARITPIYEGTNGIQALDLVMRKLPMGGGAVISSYLDEIQTIADTAGDAGLSDISASLGAAVSTLRQTTAYLLDASPADAMSGATPYQEMLGTLAGGYYLTRQALAAHTKSGSDPWLAAKVSTARFYAASILPRVHGLAGAATVGADLVYGVEVSDLGSGS
ncbi:MAG: acyl-CoA dehydrogenase, partial [Actinomycetia bacterium]|nr:acyl-CoA dehydrogenase [Actinomycetes bacterium]